MLLVTGGSVCRRLLFLYSNIYFISWMLSGKNVFLLVCAYMGINLRSGNRTVPEHLLNISYVNIFLKQQGSKRVPKHMRRYVK